MKATLNVTMKGLKLFARKIARFISKRSCLTLIECGHLDLRAVLDSNFCGIAQKGLLQKSSSNLLTGCILHQL